MADLFAAEGRLFRFMTKLMNLILLNILWIIFSIPIITMGTATSALYYVTLKMVKDEEGYIIRSFWKAFKQNLRQGIIIEAIFVVCGVILLGDIKFFLRSTNIYGYIFVAVFSIGFIIYLFMFIYTFPLVAKYNNTVNNTLRNAVVMSFKHLSNSIAMLTLLSITLYGFYVSVPIMLMILTIGASTYAYICSILLRNIFNKHQVEC